MNAHADRIAAPTQVEDRHLSARAVLPVLGWDQVRRRIAQQADVDVEQDQDGGGYAGKKEVRHYVKARR
jgi:hypothetical protein